LRLNLFGETSTTTGELDVLDPSGQEIKGASNEVNPLVELPVIGGQTYFVQANATDLTGTLPNPVRYTLSIAPAPDDFTAPVTDPLPRAGVNRVDGVIETPRDVDLFRAVAPAPGLVTVLLNTTAGDLAGVLASPDEPGAGVAPGAHKL